MVAELGELEFASRRGAPCRFYGFKLRATHVYADWSENSRLRQWVRSGGSDLQSLRCILIVIPSTRSLTLAAAAHAGVVRRRRAAAASPSRAARDARAREPLLSRVGPSIHRLSDCHRTDVFPLRCRIMGLSLRDDATAWVYPAEALEGPRHASGLVHRKPSTGRGTQATAKCVTVCGWTASDSGRRRLLLGSATELGPSTSCSVRRPARN